MNANTLVRTARRRKGLTQRELASRTGIPQPMISSIERGLQDPRYSTLERILAAVDQEIDVIDTAGRGVDRTQFVEPLRLKPIQRLRNGVAASIAIDRLVKSARRIKPKS
ncbi:MAG: helix-turn-helix transcriptional regulator [Chloroflexi bacterium]|nr:MAG: helix-turn-helix transcriptional regulator [Chloroflexota bacterium]